MSAWSRLRHRCLYVLNRSRFNEELDEEMQFHLQMKAEENLAAGMSAAEAEAVARRSFGNALRLREDSREEWGWGWFERLGQDLRFGWRVWRRSPALTAAIVLSLAIGIGANTAIFTIFDGLLLRPLPVPSPNQLVLLQWHASKFSFEGTIMGDSRIDDGAVWSASFASSAFAAFQRDTGGLCRLFAFADTGLLQVAKDGHSEIATGEVVSGNTFPILGVPARLGRTLQPSDDRPGSTPVVMLSSTFWEKYLGSDPKVVGSTIAINGHPLTIAGVVSPRFSGLEPGIAPDIFFSFASVGTAVFHGVHPEDPNTWWLQVMGRQQPGVSPARLQTALEMAFQQAIQSMKLPAEVQLPRDMPALQVMPGARGFTELGRKSETPLFILMTVVGLVLLIACVNIANLLLSRASARQQELAVRLSLGAGRARLVRQLLTESLLLAVVGAAAGLLLAQGACPAILKAMERDQPIVLALRPDFHILLFTTVLVVLSGLLFGLAPAWQATRVSVGASLKQAAPTLAGAARRWSLGRMLVVLQVALTLVLLTGAGLFLRTLHNLSNADLGLNPDHVLLFQIRPSLAGYSKARAALLDQRLRASVEALPGVEHASWSQFVPLSSAGWVSPIRMPGRTLPKSRRIVFAMGVSPGFFAAMQIPLQEGRDFIAQDSSPSAILPVVVNRAMAKRYFPSTDPVGARFSWDDPVSGTSVLKIVGVVGDAKYNSLRKAAPATVYVPFDLIPFGMQDAAFEVRTAVTPTSLITPIRKLVERLGPGVSMMEVKTERQQIAERLIQESLFARVSTVFSAVVLLLLAIGLYGVLAFSVSARTKEIGIRMALGAGQEKVLRMVLRDAAGLIAVGLAFGLPLAWLASHLIRAQLYGLQAGDPLTIAAAGVILLAVAFFAAWGPARRAAAVDPLVALRYE